MYCIFFYNIIYLYILVKNMNNYREFCNFFTLHIICRLRSTTKAGFYLPPAFPAPKTHIL